MPHNCAIECRVAFLKIDVSTCLDVYMYSDCGVCIIQMSVREMSDQFKSVRSQIEEDEMVASMMAGLRGSNINDDNFAASDVRMRLVEIKDDCEEDDSLPLVYDPELIGNYWSKRPVSLVTRIVQLMGEYGL